MDGPRRSGPAPGADPADASGAWRPSIGYLAIAIAIVVGVLAWLSMSSADVPPAVATAANSAALPAAAPASAVPAPLHAAAAAPGPTGAVPPPGPSAAAVPALAAPPQVMRQRDPDGDQTPDIVDYVNPGETPTMAEVIDRLHQAGVHGGLGAFSPPGTRPPLVGLAVPEDFALPQGYVRHYQATDDGRRIEPILMFSPDHHTFLDAARRPIAIPKDRVVPAELAPPGMPIREIVIPAPAEPGK